MPKAGLLYEKRLVKYAREAGVLSLKLERLCEKLAGASAEFMAAAEKLRPGVVIRPGYAIGVSKEQLAARKDLTHTTAQVVASEDAHVAEVAAALEDLSRVANRIVLTVPERDNPHHAELTRATGAAIAVLAARGSR